MISCDFENNSQPGRTTAARFGGRRHQPLRLDLVLFLLSLVMWAGIHSRGLSLGSLGKAGRAAATWLRKQGRVLQASSNDLGAALYIVTGAAGDSSCRVG